MPPTPAIICSGLIFAWPDGTPLFTDLSLVIGRGRTGLVGLNGSGKSTLLRLIAGELTAAHGSVRVAGELGYVPQTVTLAGTRVDEALGIAPTRAALAAIEAGDASEKNFARIGSDWDVEERARATLDSLGLEQVPLDRRISELSGGESVLLSLAAQFLRRPEVLLLDEPTNNLDLGARHRLYDAAGCWTGAMVIVSHDRELLDRVDQIAELRAGAVRLYGGNLTDYEEALAAEQEAAERMVRVAEADMRRQRRELVETQTKLDRRVRYGQKMQDTSRMPKIVANERKRQAQVSAGKFHGTQLDRLDKASKRLAEAEEALRDDAEIRVDLPATAVPAGRTVLTLSALEIRYGARADLIVRGPERIALTGRNGAGKTTLLRTITGEIPASSGEVKVSVPVRYLPQRLDILDPAQREHAPPGRHLRGGQVDADFVVVAHRLLGGRQPLPGLAQALLVPRTELARGHLGLPLEVARHDLGYPAGLLLLLPITQPPVQLDPGLDQLPLLPPHAGLRSPHLALGGLLLHRDRPLVVAEVAAVPADLAGPQLADLVHQLEQFPVVADDDHRAPPGPDGLVQPLPCGEIEVVGRLVEQQHARPPQELGRQADQHALPAGQLADPPVQRNLLEPEPVQRGPGLLLDVPVLADPREVLLAGVPGLDRRHGRPDARDAERLLDPGVRRAERQVLRQITEFARDGDRTARRRKLAGDQPQQRGLARPVDADKPGPPRADDQRKAGEYVGPVRPRETQTGTRDDGRRRRHARLLAVRSPGLARRSVTQRPAPVGRE